MSRVRWCEVEDCEEKALPDAIPPRCALHPLKKKMGRPRTKPIVEKRPFGDCVAETKFENPCAKAAIGLHGLCDNHLKMEKGEFHLNNLPDCSWKDRGCSKKAARGLTTCAEHASDPADRAEARRRARAEKMSGSPRMQALILGEMSVDELDDEELLKGQLKNVNGTFAGRPNALIPKVLHDKMVAELFKRVDQRMQSRLMDVVDTMIGIATNNFSEDKDKIKAATFIFERMRGKTPEVLQITQDKPFQVMFEKIVAGDRSARFTNQAPLPELEEAIDAEFTEGE